MGSGKGKVRRVRGAPAYGLVPVQPGIPHAAKVNFSAWHEFLAESHLEKQALGGYYLGLPGGNITRSLSADEQLKVAQELFQDFVATGALVLPAGRSVDDYEIKGSSAPGKASMKRHDSDEKLIDLASYQLRADTKLGGWQTSYLVGIFHHWVNVLNVP